MDILSFPYIPTPKLFQAAIDEKEDAIDSLYNSDNFY
jgi:hypothetical protein